MSPAKPIQKLADAVRSLLTGHIQANTQEEDARRETERDARVRAAIDQMAREGKLPPRAAAPSVPPAHSSPPAPLRPNTSVPDPHAANSDSGTDATVTPWTPGVDIRGSKHVLRITSDYQAASTYDTEEVWVVEIDPPSPAWKPRIVLRREPRTVGPWIAADQLLVCSVDDEFFYLDLAKARGQILGWGLPTPDARRFARVSGPGLKITALELINAGTQDIRHTIDIRQKLKPLAFDPTGRALACISDSDIIVIDTGAGKVIEQIPLTPLATRVMRASLPVKERLLVYTGAAAPKEFSIPWSDA